MATTTLEQRRGTSRWKVGGVVFIAFAIIAALVINALSSSATTQASTVTVTHGSVVARVSGSGSITAAQSLDLPFQTSGAVVEVLVEEGDVVEAGQALARLDTRDLEIQVANAAANLESAQARLVQTQEGNATEQDIAAAQASLSNAEAQLQRTQSGNVTAADIASAEAALRSAQATLDDLRAGSKPDQLAAAQAKLDQAQANLESQRSNLAIAKTTAQSQMEQSANNLRDAQAEYSQIYWDNRELEDQLSKFGRELSLEDINREEAALRAIENAEASLAQAQLNYEQAQQAEVSGIATAESQVRDAEEQLRSVQQGATEAELIQAQATVEQRQADLQKLRQGGTAVDIAAAQATVNQQQANLEKLTAPATATDLEIQQASVAQAEQSLAQAQLQLSYATLTAPFGGVVSAVNIVPGSVVTTGTPAISLIDRDPLHVDLSLNENDVAQVELGQPVTLLIDALENWETTGTVTYIAPAAENVNGVVTYGVQVSFPDDDQRVKVGMTANIDIITAQEDDVLLVPNSALLPKGAGQVVQITDAEGNTREVEVVTGLSDDAQTEIVSGLNEGDEIVALPRTNTQGAQGGGFFGGVTQ
ncbi:MAG: efflux RND transporter periplasmic adaptor subunit [Chloroflexales bacterium]|nr:efflux RND transporter periplasmic adaptor subunit [Chloroflexales bacterium]